MGKKGKESMNKEEYSRSDINRKNIEYKQEGGDLSWNSFRRAFANNEINI